MLVTRWWGKTSHGPISFLCTTKGQLVSVRDPLIALFHCYSLFAAMTASITFICDRDTDGRYDKRAYKQPGDERSAIVGRTRLWWQVVLRRRHDRALHDADMSLTHVVGSTWVVERERGGVQQRRGSCRKKRLLVLLDTKRLQDKDEDVTFVPM